MDCSFCRSFELLFCGHCPVLVPCCFQRKHLLWHRNHSSINSIARQLFGQISAKLMLLWSEESTDPPFNAIWKASDDPKHTANYVKAYLDRKKNTQWNTFFLRLASPSTVWHHLDRGHDKRQPLSIEEVYNVLREKPKELFMKTTWRT